MVFDLIARGAVKVVVSGTMPLDDVRAAHDRLEKGGFRGKLALTIE